MQIPAIKTLSNRKGEIIKVLKQEVKIPVVTKEVVKGSLNETTTMNTISKRIRTIVYDRLMNPIRCREVSVHKGKVLSEDVYQRALIEGTDLKQHIDGKTKVTNLVNKSFEELAANFFK